MKRSASIAGIAGHLAGAAWAWWVWSGPSPSSALAGALYLALLPATAAAYLALDRREGAVGPCLGVYGAAALVSLAHVARDTLGPLAALGFRPGPAAAWVGSLAGMDMAIFAAPLPALAAAAYLWLETLLAAAKAKRARTRRDPAESALYGRSRLLSRHWMRQLESGRGIILGQARPGNAPLVSWPLEGSALTLAPPRVGKGATIAMNLLSPADRGWNGSTVIIDPRGELYCVAARRRREMGRRVVLLDPFRVVAGYRDAFGELHLPAADSATYNPLMWIREDEADGPRDIQALVDAMTTPPPADGRGNARHFYESARSLISGYMAWVRFCSAGDPPTLATLHRYLGEGDMMMQRIAGRLNGGPGFPGRRLTEMAIGRQMAMGKEEAGSTFTSVANEIEFLAYPDIVAQTSHSSFDPHTLADGDTDLFVVLPEEMLERCKAWLRLWVTIPNAIPARRPLDRDMLVIIDEMPRIGTLKPVLDAFTMAAGKGIHYWCFAQSLNALEAAWGRDNRRMLLELSEVVQILGFPRGDPAGADEMSKALGHATFETQSESRSGSQSAAQLMAAGQLQTGMNTSLVRERLVTPEELLTMPADEQFVIAAPKAMPRDALHLRHARYWERDDASGLADPNPLVVRRRAALRPAA